MAESLRDSDRELSNTIMEAIRDTVGEEVIFHPKTVSEMSDILIARYVWTVWKNMMIEGDDRE